MGADFLSNAMKKAIPKLPPGFTLDPLPGDRGIPPLPPGFTLDPPPGRQQTAIAVAEPPVKQEQLPDWIQTEISQDPLLSGVDLADPALQEQLRQFAQQRLEAEASAKAEAEIAGWAKLLEQSIMKPWMRPEIPLDSALGDVDLAQESEFSSSATLGIDTVERFGREQPEVAARLLAEYEKQRDEPAFRAMPADRPFSRDVVPHWAEKKHGKALSDYLAGMASNTFHGIVYLAARILGARSHEIQAPKGPQKLWQQYEWRVGTAKAERYGRTKRIGGMAADVIGAMPVFHTIGGLSRIPTGRWSARLLDQAGMYSGYVFARNVAEGKPKEEAAINSLTSGALYYGLGAAFHGLGIGARKLWYKIKPPKTAWDRINAAGIHPASPQGVRELSQFRREANKIIGRYYSGRTVPLKHLKSAQAFTESFDRIMHFSASREAYVQALLDGQTESVAMLTAVSKLPASVRQKIMDGLKSVIVEPKVPSISQKFTASRAAKPVPAKAPVAKPAPSTRRQGPVAKAAKAKEPWEMTKEQYTKTPLYGVEEHISRGAADWSPESAHMTLSGLTRTEAENLIRKSNAKPFHYAKLVKKGFGTSEGHKRRVRDAVCQGKPVPRNVLEEYKGEAWADEALAKIKPAPEVAKGEAEIRPSVRESRTLGAVKLDVVRRWPADIPKVGSDFWTAVMDAAKQLATPYRYKALRSALGRFRHGGKREGIELRDVAQALTATHELGHNIDWLLNDKAFPSSIKARFPDVDAGERALRTELQKVSKIIRPDLWAEGLSKSTKAYARRGTELMADFVSGYILDPKKTADLAPNMTKALSAKLKQYPDIAKQITRLQESRTEGVKETPVAAHAREAMKLPPAGEPLSLKADLQEAEDYVNQAKQVGLAGIRHKKVLKYRASQDAKRIRDIVPSAETREDLRVLAENGTRNLRTGKTRAEIERELTPKGRKALQLYRAYQERARQTVNEYLRGESISEYISFLEDYFIHAYETPMTQKYRSAISKWAKRSPQARKRVLPTLEEAVELGLTPRAHDIAEGLELWAGINYRVATNIAMLKELPKITNDDGESILQNPKNKPDWPTVDYWPIRRTYAMPFKGQGVLLFQGRVAVDPRVKPYIDALFGSPPTSTPARALAGLNAVWKGFQLTLFSFFHHQAEFFSAIGALGPEITGMWGKKAEAFGKTKPLGFLPARIGILKAGKMLENTPEVMEDYLRHGGQTGYITTEGRNIIERMLKGAEDYLANIIHDKPVTGAAVWAPYVSTKTTRATYAWFQHLLWDNVQRAKLVAYYNITTDGLQNSNLSPKQVKEIAAKYVADNFGGQEWFNTAFRNPKTRWALTQLMMSLNWTWSQIKTATWPWRFGSKTAQQRAARRFMRKIGRRHWFWYLSSIAGFTILGNMAMTGGKPPWENEEGHKLDVDWTSVWRKLPWNSGLIGPSWKERGDTARRYITLGKAGREIIRWVQTPLKAFGYKLSPVARTLVEQLTGTGVGTGWQEPWAREDMDLWENVSERFKHLMENFKPFAFSGNNAFLAFPSRKGMTQWKAIKAYHDIYKAKGNVAAGGPRALLTKASRLLDKNSDSLMNAIAEACKANGVDPKKARNAARAKARSHFYRKFRKALQHQNIKACNRWAKALDALGVTTEGMKQSLRYHKEQLSPEAYRMAIKAWQSRRAK